MSSSLNSSPSEKCNASKSEKLNVKIEIIQTIKKPIQGYSSLADGDRLWGTCDEIYSSIYDPLNIHYHRYHCTSLDPMAEFVNCKYKFFIGCYYQTFLLNLLHIDRPAMRLFESGWGETGPSS